MRALRQVPLFKRRNQLLGARTSRPPRRRVLNSTVRKCLR